MKNKILYLLSNHLLGSIAPEDLGISRDAFHLMLFTSKVDEMDIEALKLRFGWNGSQYENARNELVRMKLW